MDVISDMLTIIRNAQAVKKETVVIPHSKLKMEILKVLVKGKFLKEVEAKGKKNKKIIEVTLANISHIKRISKTSKRVYLPVNKIKMVRRGLGAFIISTPKGILTDKEARREKVGGEIMFEIW